MSAHKSAGATLLVVTTIGVCLVAMSRAPASGPALALAIDPAQSRVVILVGKAGLLGFAGHAHQVIAPVDGRIEMEPNDWQQTRVSLDVEATMLRVMPTNEPAADVPKVQRVMQGDQVLDVTRFPRITFQSRRVLLVSRHGASGAVLIDGDLSLHGATRPATIRAEVSVEPGGDLTARGDFAVKQSEFGMVPVVAAGGTVRVKDELEIHFVLKASPSH